MTGIETNVIHTGDCLDVLGELPESSVHMTMTSPPYFGLRDYGVNGQFGLEESLDKYIDNLVQVGDELRRVLRDDGSWWLNLGDSYAGSGRGQWDGNNDQPKESYTPENGQLPKQSTGMKRKNKMLVPHRVAIALQEAGWVVRNDVTWVKPNPMPSPVKDRLNTATEQIFHLTPQPDYWYDLDAIREQHAESSMKRLSQNNGNPVNNPEDVNHPDGMHNFNADELCHPAGKNPGDVFEITTKPFPEAHFAVYPPELCERPIKASCPPKVCAECGSGYVRDVDREAGEYDYSDRCDEVKGRTQASGTQQQQPSAECNGWLQACDCDTDDTQAGIILDPFAGAGTTLLKAKELGRKFVGIELNPEYADMARARVGLSPNDPANIRDSDDQQGLEAFSDGGQP